MFQKKNQIIKNENEEEVEENKEDFNFAFADNSNNIQFYENYKK